MFRFTIKRMGPSLMSMSHGRMRASDINIDGYPDMFLTLEFEDHNKNTFYQSFLLLSQPCEDGVCSSSAVNHVSYGNANPRRYFKKNINKDVDSTVLTSMTKSETQIMVPHDVDEDGRIDVIVQNCYTEGSSKNCHITALYNNYNFDSYFIKSVFLS